MSSSMRAVLTRITLTLTVVAATLAGCGKAVEMGMEELAEQQIEKETGGNAKVDIDSSNGKFTMESSDGENAIRMEAGDSVELPANLPADVPLPEGATWQLVQTANEGSGNLMLQGTVDTPLAALAETLKAKVAEQGWESVQNITHEGSVAMMTFSKGEQTLTYNLANDGGKTSVTVAKG